MVARAILPQLERALQPQHLSAEGNLPLCIIAQPLSRCPLEPLSCAERIRQELLVRPHHRRPGLGLAQASEQVLHVDAEQLDAGEGGCSATAGEEEDGCL